MDYDELKAYLEEHIRESEQKVLDAIAEHKESQMSQFPSDTTDITFWQGYLTGVLHISNRIYRHNVIQGD